MVSAFIIILYLAILEIILSLDNALALATLVKRNLSDEKEQKKALYYGMWGAYLFRILILLVGVWIISFTFVKVIAGLYLIQLAIKELFFSKDELESVSTDKKSIFSSFIKSKFILTIISVEIMDLSFSVDSIAATLTISNSKILLILGAILGILAMRFAANLFIKLLNIFPILEKTAFILILLAGIKILLSTINVFDIPDLLYIFIMIAIIPLSILFDKYFLKGKMRFD